MNYFKRFISVVSAVAISVSCFSSVASAERAEKFINVGYDSDGDAYLLDRTSLRKREPEFLVRASCGDETLSIVGFRTYTQDGVKLTEDKVRQQVQPRTDSPASLAMSYHCHAIGARGW